MSSIHDIGQEASVEEQANEQLEAAVVDEVAEREQWLEPSVDQEIQSKVDYENDRALDGRLFGQTLVAEERMAAREWEIERTRVRWDRRPDSDREMRCREAVEHVSLERRCAFGKRAASVDPWAEHLRADAREQLTRDELAAVNRESQRLAQQLGGFSSAAVSRLVAQRVIDGRHVTDAVLDVFEQLRTAPGQVIPIAAVGEVGRREVDIEGTVSVLWEPSHRKIQQVGLLEDESGRIKFTSWKKSRIPMVREGECVRLRGVARNWYRGRVSVALTGWSRVVFPDRQ